MTTNEATPASQAQTPKTPDKVYVKIPKAGPGQGYQAPKNFQQPLLQGLSTLIIWLLCIALPITPAAIVTMIIIKAPDYLWLFLPLGIIVECVAFFVAIGLGREALGTSGGGRYTR
jgi:hypothetical protein